MNGLKRKTLAFVLALGCAAGAFAASSKTWEEVTAPVPAVTQSLEADGETEVSVHDGYIYIRTDRAVTVKIFSILGQLISQETVKPGLHRIRLSSRGIFILRVGTTTRRITL